MPLSSGVHLGSYEIIAPLGAGGMGEVYRARDTKLGREVALKLLPESFTHDAERVARFRREAQVLASLNHPHIAAIHGVDEANGQQFLVLELVDGETLSFRIARGALATDEILAIAKQLAEALEAAHEKGIVHRDLKPANIALTREGQAKVLDFGLAKALEPVGSAELSMSPTLTFGATQAGVILGTAAYMAPEQAKGRTADKRSDVWSFGCVLFEMLTRRRAFEGEDVSDTLATVLKNEPEWALLPADLSPSVRALVEGCLKKDPKRRIGDMSTVRFLLDEPRAVTSVVHPAVATARAASPRRRAIYLAIAALVGAAVTAAIARTNRAAEPLPIARFALPLPDKQQFVDANRQNVAISPDGTQIAFATNSGLYIRTLSELEPRLVERAGIALDPTFSPDGRSLAYWSREENAIKRVSLAGGAPIIVTQATPAPVGTTWSSIGILYAMPSEGILRVSPNGGKVETVVALKNRLDAMLSPVLLPDGDTIMYSLATTTASDGWDRAQIIVHSIKSGTSKTVFEGGSDARYLPTGHIVYAVGGTLFAMPFDASRQQVTGESIPVLEGVRRASTSVSGAVSFAVAANGTLVYIPGPSARASGRFDLMLFDRKGDGEPLKMPSGAYGYPRISPDGKRLAFATNEGKETIIWVYDLSGTASARRITFGGSNRFPIWSADSRRVIFQSDRDGDGGLYWQPADGGAIERLTKSEPGVTHIAETASPDGDTILMDVAKNSGHELWALSVRDRKAAPVAGVQGPIPSDAVFSPDGHWIAYQTVIGSDGEYTFVQPFPPTGTKHQIAKGGRNVWSPDGKELFIIPGPGQFAAVTITTQPSFAFTPPVTLTRGFGVADPAMPRTFDVAPDGRMIGVITSGQGQSLSSGIFHLNLVLNWFEDVKARVR